MSFSSLVTTDTPNIRDQTKQKWTTSEKDLLLILKSYDANLVDDKGILGRDGLSLLEEFLR